MEQVELFKALANQTRLQILTWLKDPHVHFPEIDHEGHKAEVGVCVGLIQKKSGLTQSTISAYLSLLHRAQLVRATRIGQWTYYARNEQAFRDLGNLISSKL